MGEAGLGAAEVGEKIAEHREHSMHAQPTGRDRIITIIEAALLAAVALMTAWSGYASAKWSTESRLQIAEASAARTEANRAANEAASNKEFDSLAFNLWFGEFVDGNIDAATVAERRFRTEFAVAFHTWIATDPFNNVNAPAGPTYMPQYKQPELEHADELIAHADELADEGAASAVSGHFRLRSARYGLIATASVILVVAVALLVTSPWPPA